MAGKTPRVWVVVFAGVIGTGKSTCLARLRATGALEKALGGMRVIFVREPEDKWHDGGHNWLEEFYANREMNAHAFQIIVFDTHVAAIEEALSGAAGEDCVLVVERSIYDQLLFWKQQVDDRLTTTGPIFDAAYMRVWRRWRQLIPPVSLIFFLRTDNLQCTMQRLAKRELRISPTRSVFHVSLGEEPVEEVAGISLAYQEALFRKHEAWYTTPVAHPPEAPEGGIPCVHINVDAPYHEEDASLFRLAEEMATHIKRLM